MSSCELTAAVWAVANAIACGLSVGELGLAASLFVQLGDTLATVAAQRSLAASESADKSCTRADAGAKE